jgi:hypothetical protein
MARRRWIAVLSLVAACAVADEARAAKEKFVRNKPHVNISGPWRLSGETLAVKLGLLLPAVQAGRAAEDCGGVLDLRVVRYSDPDGTPLAESTDLRVAPGGTASLSFDADSVAPGAPIDVYVVIVAREMDGVKTPDCVLRGQVEMTNNASGATTRSLPIRASEFVALKKQ